MNPETIIFMSLMAFTISTILFFPFILLKLNINATTKYNVLVESKILAFGLPLFASFNFKEPQYLFACLGLAILNIALALLVYNYSEHEIKYPKFSSH